MKKSVAPAQQSFSIATWARQARIPGQVPSHRQQEREIMASVEKHPQHLTPELLMAYTGPVFTPRKIVENLGLSQAQEQHWAKFLEGVTHDGPNEIVLRQGLFQKFQEEKLDSSLRNAIFQRAMNYTRTLRKSLEVEVEVFTPDELLKGEAERFVIYPDQFEKSARGGNTIGAFRGKKSSSMFIIQRAIPAGQMRIFMAPTFELMCFARKLWRGCKRLEIRDSGTMIWNPMSCASA